MNDYVWTHKLTPENTAGIDLIEVDRCVDFGTFIERDHHEADEGLPRFYSVYLHRPGEGADCVADRPTVEEARDYAATLSQAFEVPIHDYAQTTRHL